MWGNRKAADVKPEKENVFFLLGL